MNGTRSLGIGPVGAFMPGEDVTEPAPLVSREMLQAFGPSLLSRMREADTAQQQRWQAGERSPTPMTEDRAWLADDVAGSLLGPMGIMGAIKAYHGSPHRFDRFDMSKIGTGEGAQAFGHGLYFSEAPGVARSYRDALGRPANTGNDGRDMAQWAFSASRGDRASAAQKLKDEVSRYDKQGWPTPDYRNQYDEAIGILERGEDVGGGALYTTRLDVEPDDLLDWDAPLSQQSEKVKKALGFSTLSEDQIHDEALRLMEEGNKKVGRVGGWQDDPAIKARIDELQDELDRLPPNITGADYYRGSEPDNWLHSTLAGGNSSPSMSEELRRRGVPGIRYLDQQSRYIPSNLPDNPIANEARQFLDAASGDADAALKAFNDSNPVQRLASDERDEVRKVIKAAGRQATRNFVIFDDKLIDIEGVE